MTSLFYEFNIVCLDSKYKLDHTVIVFLRLSTMSSKSKHVVANCSISFFCLWLLNILLYVCVCVCACVCMCVCVYICYTCCIHSSFSGTWLASMFWMLKQPYTCRCLFELVLLFALDEHSEVELLYHISSTFIFCLFLVTSILFSKVTAPIDIPTNSAQGFSFLNTSSSILESLCVW